MAVPISRKASITPSVRHSRKAGRRRLRIRAYITTNIGRVLLIVDTSDTGPLCNAHIDSNIAVGAIVSFKAINANDDFFRFILTICLRTLGLTEISRNEADIKKALIQNIFQNDI